MIVARPPNKRLKLPRLASTPYREIAYHVPYTEELYGGAAIDEDPLVVSPSGENWMPLFLENGRVTVFISGNPRCGKSYFAREIIDSLPEDAHIILFTALEEEDGHFKEWKKEGRLTKITVKTENLKPLEELTLTKIRSYADFPILLFDDVDTIKDEKLKRALFKLMNDVLANGRGHTKHDGTGDVHVICTSHSPNNYVQTKYTTENSEYIAIPPCGTTWKQYKTMMDKLGVPEDLQKLSFQEGKKGKFRFTIIKQTTPMYMIFGDTITLL